VPPAALASEPPPAAARATPATSPAAARDGAAAEAGARLDATVSSILQADDVPAFSRVMRDIMDSMGRDETSAQHLANLVLRDYALTVKVIRAANSAHFNRTGRPVQSATHALMLLGARTVRELAAGVMLFEHYRRRSPGLKELMLLSLLTASHARLAAETAGGADPETAHLCGMFRSLGEVLVAAHLPEAYAEVLRAVAERSAAGGAGRGAARVADAALRATCATVVLGGPFEEVGVAIARHWGMPDVVRLGMRATGAPGEDRTSAFTAFAHALTGAVYREDPARAAAAADVVVAGLGTRAGLTRPQCRDVADRAIADTRELFAAAGVRLDDLRLARQVARALTTADAPSAARPAGGRRAAGADAPAEAPAEVPPDGAAPPLAATPATSTLAVTPEAGPSLPELRAHLVTELAGAASDPPGFDVARLILLALEAVLRGGPFDRAALHAADAAASEFRPRTALGEGTAHLLAGPGIPFAAAGGPSGPALLAGTEVHLAHGTRLTLAEARLLRGWDATNVVLVPVRVAGAVIGCVHADRRTAFTAADAAAMAYVREVVRGLEQGIALRRGAAVAPPRTFDAQAKVAAVVRVLRGEDAAQVAREIGADAGALAAWQSDFLAGAAARLA
jgi:HD-like signal output (HDOD) protein